MTGCPGVTDARSAAHRRRLDASSSQGVARRQARRVGAGLAEAETPEARHPLGAGELATRYVARDRDLRVRVEVRGSRWRTKDGATARISKPSRSLIETIQELVSALDVSMRTMSGRSRCTARRLATLTAAPSRCPRWSRWT